MTLWFSKNLNHNNIHDILGNGAYKLRTLDRKVLKIPVNSERLKIYHQRPLPEPYVLIEG